MAQVKKIASVVSAAVVAAMGFSMSATAGILAQSIVDISGLTIRVANGGSGRSDTLVDLNSIQAVQGNTATIPDGNGGTVTVPKFGRQTYDAGAALNSNTQTGPSGAVEIIDPAVPVIINETSCFGNGCPHTPGTGLVLGEGRDAASSSVKFSGNAFTSDGADLLLDSTVAIGSGSGSASNNTSLGLDFSFTLAQGATPFGLELYFNASTVFTRLLEKTGETANATLDWSFSLTRDGTVVAVWEPGPLGGTVFGGSALSTGNLNPFGGQIGNLTGNSTGGIPSTVFEFETDDLIDGTYILSLETSTAADGSAVAAPGSLALLALGLLGLAGRVGCRSRSFS